MTAPFQVLGKPLGILVPERHVKRAPSTRGLTTKRNDCNQPSTSIPVARASNALGDAARLQDQLARATVLYQESLDLSRELKGGGVGVMVLSNIGHLAHQIGD